MKQGYEKILLRTEIEYGAVMMGMFVLVFGIVLPVVVSGLSHINLSLIGLVFALSLGHIISSFGLDLGFTSGVSRRRQLQVLMKMQVGFGLVDACLYYGLFVALEALGRQPRGILTTMFNVAPSGLLLNILGFVLTAMAIVFVRLLAWGLNIGFLKQDEPAKTKSAIIISLGTFISLALLIITFWLFGMMTELNRMLALMAITAIGLVVVTAFIRHIYLRFELLRLE
ncbi:hypothetical protein [Lacticaseibacillus hulanensis]|uniref:hypothetical protein n=1 Tax=Lacticaseibacillus hulanensis TaxID=2493111 RepID=UPI000FD7696A|nr:hypothetical protein [Lacticaseibacillus hulanensis]